MKFAAPEEKLKERVKKLTCLYEISKTISQSDSIEKKVLKKVISSTKKAWRFDDDAIVELQIQDRIITTKKILSKNVFQISYITIENSCVGFIKVHYPEEKYTQDHFLQDKQKLLDTIAFEIGNYIDKFQKIERETLLRKSAERADRLSNEVIFKKDNIIAKVDPVQITQILFNLLINAMYASPANSCIKPIIDSDAQNLLIVIENQGSGIPLN